MARRSRRTRRILLGSLVAAAAWAFAEGAVATLFRTDLDAWSAPPPAPRDDVHVLSGNPYLIYEYPPGSYVDGGVLVHVNSVGLRGPEVTIPKPTGIRRFLTTGDSSIFGFGVLDDQVFSSVAAARLGPPVEGVCGAIPGYSTVQTLNLLHLRALATEPDLLVVGNLWSDNNFDSFVDRDVIATYAGWESSWTGRLRRLLVWSPIYRVLDWRLRVKGRAEAIQKAGWMIGNGQQVGPRRVAIQDYAENLDTLAHLTLDRGGDVVFLLPANRVDVEGGVTAVLAWSGYRQVMRDAATRLGAPLLDVPAVFRRSGLTADELFQDEMHPTAVGHRLIGEALADLLSPWARGEHVSTGSPGGPVPAYADAWAGMGGKLAEATAPPDGADAATTGAGPEVAAPRKLHGTVTFAGYTSGDVYVDALPPTGDVVVGNARLSAPGSFELPLGDAELVTLRAFVDEGKDGIDPADRMWSFPPLSVAGAPAAVTLDLDAGTLVSAAP